jgi:hypothetical protein
MPHDEILWLTTIPVTCPKCLEQTPLTVGGLIARDAVICSSCGHSINVKDGEWRAFIQQIAERLRGVVIPGRKR